MGNCPRCSSRNVEPDGRVGEILDMECVDCGHNFKVRSDDGAGVQRGKVSPEKQIGEAA